MGATRDMISRMRRGADMLQAVAALPSVLAHERWSREQLLEHQRRAFGVLVRHAAAHTRLYADLYRGLDLSGEIDPARLPTIDKALLMERYDESVTDRRLTREAVLGHAGEIVGDATLFGRYRVISTSGTSGLRGYFVQDGGAWRAVLVDTLRWFLWMGLSLRVPPRRVGAIGAHTALHVTSRVALSADSGLFRLRYFPATEPVPTIAQGLAAFRPEALLGYPSIIALLALEQIEGRLSIAPRIVSTHSEVLGDAARARIREAWNAPIFDHYGLTEAAHVASECPAHRGLHVLEDRCLMEIVDEKGLPVPDRTPGARWLLTNLSNRVQPLIRYEVTDILTRDSAPCPCGRPFALLSGIGGRSEDVLRLPSAAGEGTVPVSPHAVALRIEDFPEIAEYALSFDEGRIALRIVARADAASEGLGPAAAERLAALIREAGAVPPPISAVIVPDLPRRRARMGKHHAVSAG